MLNATEQNGRKAWIRLEFPDLFYIMLIFLYNIEFAFLKMGGRNKHVFHFLSLFNLTLQKTSSQMKKQNNRVLHRKSLAMCFLAFVVLGRYMYMHPQCYCLQIGNQSELRMTTHNVIQKWNVEINITEHVYMKVGSLPCMPPPPKLTKFIL